MISLPIIWIAIIPVGIYGGVKKEEVRGILNEEKDLNNIFDAAQSGDLEVIKKLSDEDMSSVNHQSADGTTHLLQPVLSDETRQLICLSLWVLNWKKKP